MHVWTGTTYSLVQLVYLEERQEQEDMEYPNEELGKGNGKEELKSLQHKVRNMIT